METVENEKSPLDKVGKGGPESLRWWRYLGYPDWPGIYGGFSVEFYKIWD